MEKRLVVCGEFVRLFVGFVIFRINPYVFFRHHLQEPTKAQSWQHVYIYTCVLVFINTYILVFINTCIHYPYPLLPEFVCLITRVRV